MIVVGADGIVRRVSVTGTGLFGRKDRVGR